MAIYFEEGSCQGRQAMVYADYDEDVKNYLQQFGENNHLKRGAKCFCLETKKSYFLTSDGKWV